MSIERGETFGDQRSGVGDARRLREEKRLTLDEAARLTGVSRSMLAQIEKGEVNPTISVLWKIANGYKVSFTSLVEDQRGPVDVRRQADIQPLEEDGGRYVNYPVFPFSERTLFETYRIVIHPGGHLEAQPHLKGAEEYVTVFAGRAEITVDGRAVALDREIHPLPGRRPPRLPQFRDRRRRVEHAHLLPPISRGQPHAFAVGLSFCLSKTMGRPQPGGELDGAAARLGVYVQSFIRPALSSRKKRRLMTTAVTAARVMPLMDTAPMVRVRPERPATNTTEVRIRLRFLL